MNIQEYEESLEYTKNKVNLNYQMARVTIKENLSQFTKTQKKMNSMDFKSSEIPQEKILSNNISNRKEIPLFQTNEIPFESRSITSQLILRS
jgi:hypothetical protein